MPLLPGDKLPNPSTCPMGEEQWVEYFHPITKKPRVQYDYRAPDGKLFGCLADNIEAARAKRDAWMERRKSE